MKALVRQQYGPPSVLRVEEVLTPEPGAHEILIRVRAASINLGDWELLTGQPPYISVLAHLFSRSQRYTFAPTSVTNSPANGRPPKMKILGTDFAGRVEAVGDQVTRFKVGDHLFGMAERFGAFAEFVCVPEKGPFAKIPTGMNFEQAAALPQATHIALQGIRDIGKVRSGQSVLINGGGGGAGTLAIQLAKMYGATVTAVDGPTKLELMRSIGADHVMDYTQESFLNNGQRYDLILDMAAYQSIFDSRRSLTNSGIYLLGGGSGEATLQAALLGPLLRLFSRRKIVFLLAASRSNDLEQIGALWAEGHVNPILDRSFSLEQAGEALQRVGDKLGLGNVLIVP